jgi:hypothetical protein
MPNSVFSSGGGGTSSSAVRQGINNSEDIDALLFAINEIKDGLGNLTVSTELRAPTLRPVVIGNANEVVSSGEIPAPGVGKILMIQIAGWYGATPTDAFLSIVGTDNQIYMKVPIVAAGAGFMLKSELPENIGCTVQLTAGGDGVHGYLNVATYVRDL